MKSRRWGGSVRGGRLGWVAAMALAGWAWGNPVQAGADGLEPPYSIRVWRVEDGLPDNVVHAIQQGPDGYLWISTPGGLARFDGVRFRVFDRREPGLESDRSVRMAPGAQGELWISMDRGELVRLQDGRFTTFDASAGWPMERFQARGGVRLPDGAMVFVTASGSLWRYDGRHFSGMQGPPTEQPVTGMVNDEADPACLWGRTVQDLFRFDGESWTQVPTHGGAESGEEHRRFVAMAPRHGGGVWLLRRGSVTGIQPDGGEPLVFPFLEIPSAASLVEDAQEQFWIGTWSAGLVHLNGRTGGVRVLGREEGFPAASVRAMILDREGNLWVGTNGSGLVRVRPGIFGSRDRARDFPAPDFMPLSLAEDENGRIWVGRLDGGLAVIDRAGAVHSGEPGPINAWSAAARRDGRLWFGTYAGVWFKLDQAGRTALLGTNKVDGASPLIRTLCEDSHGTLWVGTEGGLWRHNDAKGVLEPGADGSIRDAVQVIERDPGGGLWIGLRDDGLLHLHGAEVKRIEGELPSPGVRSLLAEREGSLWIGTRLGLALYRHGRIRPIDAGERLGEAEVTGILDDQAGSLWLGSTRGVFRLSRTGIEAFLRGETRRVHPGAYGTVDGLPSNQSASGCPSALRARDGRLWFATVDGVAVVDAARLPRSLNPPRMVVEEVLVDGVPGAGRGSVAPATVTVPPGPRRVDIRYTGISLGAPEAVHFRWRMVGFDSEWREVGGERIASFHGLPPGRYRFEVMAGNNDGVWSASAATAALIIRPAWWQTWWFRAAGGGALAGMVALGYGARVARLERARRMQREFSRRLMESQEQERRRLASELHDSLGQNLLVIKNRALLGLRHETQAARMSQELAQVSELASQSLREVRAMAHELRPFQLDELGLTQAITHIARRLGDASDIEVGTDLEDLDGALPKSAEIHFFRSVQECLTNIAKHSGARTASVRVRREGNHLAALIRDDGCGFDLRGAGAGFGLRSLRERVGTLGGRIEFESRPGAGVRVEIVVPLAEAIPPES
ncbi:MAG: hypothetical protein KF833_20510 [Verrucomicrobiae bacterium]|nr:hypothetical protein [Verrucomicrobiae bacterium]